jgi:hypothetical protein
MFDALPEQESVKDYAEGYSVSFLQNFKTKTKPREVIQKAIDDINDKLEISNDPNERFELFENLLIMTKLLEDKDNEESLGDPEGSKGPEGIRGPGESSGGESSKDKGKGKEKK